jgi:hypothetical protein
MSSKPQFLRCLLLYSERRTPVRLESLRYLSCRLEKSFTPEPRALMGKAPAAAMMIADAYAGSSDEHDVKSTSAGGWRLEAGGWIHGEG